MIHHPLFHLSIILAKFTLNLYEYQKNADQENEEKVTGLF